MPILMLTPLLMLAAIADYAAAMLMLTAITLSCAD